MRGPFLAFRAKLDDLRQFVRSADYVDALASAAANAGIVDHRGEGLAGRCAELIDTTSRRRRFVYAAVVVDLYGSFEAYAEDLVMAYLEALDLLCPTFQHLPASVQAKHVDVSASLLLNREVEKYRERCDVEEVVRRLSRAGAQTGERRLNELAFIEHRANFRADSLGEFFRDAGVPDLLRKIKAHPEVRRYLSDVEGLESIERLGSHVVLKDLDDLAQRRNEVAHGAPGSILSTESMLARVEFMGVLGTAMLAVTEDEFATYLLKHGVEQLPNPLEVFRGRIACFALTAGSIGRGSRVITTSPTGELRHGEVVQLEIGGTAVDSVSAPPAVNVGVELSFGVRDTYQFFLVR